MDTQAIAKEFKANGCAVVRGVFSPAELAEIERQIAIVIRDGVPKMKTGDVFYEDGPEKTIKSLFRLNEHGEIFRQLMVEPRFLAILKAIFPEGEVAASGGAFYFGKAAHAGSVTPAHQDNGFQNYIPPDVLIITIALDESTPENGALTVQKGSHTIGILPHRPSGVLGFSQTLVEPLSKEKYPEIHLCMKPGDICLHHTNAVHYSGANKTSKSRRQLGIQFKASTAVRDEAGWARYQADLKKLYAEKGAAVGTMA